MISKLLYWIDLLAQKQGFEEGKRLGLVSPDARFEQKPPITLKELREERKTIFP